MASIQSTRKLVSYGMAFMVASTSMAALAKDVMVGGAPMLPTKDIIDNAVNSKDHTTLVAAVKAAGLVDTLKGPGPFTVFAPTNAAFAALPAGTVDNLLKPENKGTLTTVLTYHVVSGKWDAAAISKMIKDGGGKASIKTVSGGTLVAKAQGGKVTLTDEKGGTATVTIPDVYQSNGVIHVIDKVLLPQ
ncbi:fasciclin domain-containing protein [Comamonas sp.]|uniref:fasciclin domain-containing protein n=1 Tax=Comamonas sp. TaxID=34028 RepID=UPI00289C5BBF|nr:fasciclin domain-containing protein [Comamonas sp.]